MSRSRLPLSVLALAGVSLAVAACGSSGGSGSSGGATNSSTTQQGAQAGGTQGAAFQKYQQCLKDNGVTLPDRGQGRPGGGNGYGGPPPGAGGSSAAPPSTATPPTTTNGAPPAGGGFRGRLNDPKFQKAMKACAKLRPQGARGGPGGGNGAGRPNFDIKAFTPYLTCLKGKGLDVKVSDGFNALRGLKQDDPKVQAAFKACQSKLPQRQRGGGTSTTSTTGAA